MKRLLIAGFGDVARRALPLLESRFAVLRLSRREGYDLDRPETLRLGACDALLHCAPPPATGDVDTRTVNLVAALSHPRRLSASAKRDSCAPSECPFVAAGRPPRAIPSRYRVGSLR